jgi:hypothetical protein
MSNLKSVGNKLFKTELTNHKIDLATIDEVNKLYEKGINALKEADVEKQKVAQMYSRALIILDMNVPAQLDEIIKKLIDLGINDKANELKQLKQEASKKASEYNKIYNNLK